ncbi:MAG: L-threonylcarbamoyladenylate synthase [Planctomycetota bacterium]
MEVFKASESGAIKRAAAVLRDGGLVGMPTETVYGLAADAMAGEAVARVFEAKGRPSFDPLIVHGASAGQLWEVVASEAGWPGEWVADGREHRVVMALAECLAEAFWPGPLTLVLPVREGSVSGLVTAGLGTVGVRVPGHPVSRRLIELAGVPLAAPSANRFGGISPTRAAHVVQELADRAGVVLDGGPCERGLESTVVGFGAAESDGEGPVVEVLRLGSLSVERLEETLAGRGRVRVHRGTSRPEGVKPVAEAPPAPGMLDRHYAPRTPMVVVDGLEQVSAGADRLSAALGLGDGLRMGRWGVFLSVLPVGDPESVGAVAAESELVGAAAGFFERLRRLDARGYDGIVAVRAPHAGLGRAINDRLERGALKV